MKNKSVTLATTMTVVGVVTWILYSKFSFIFDFLDTRIDFFVYLAMIPAMVLFLTHKEGWVESGKLLVTAFCFAPFIIDNTYFLIVGCNYYLYMNDTQLFIWDCMPVWAYCVVTIFYFIGGIINQKYTDKLWKMSLFGILIGAIYSGIVWENVLHLNYVVYIFVIIPRPEKMLVLFGFMVLTVVGFSLLAYINYKKGN